MNNFKITSNYGLISFGPICIGWNNHWLPVVNENDCGDETFGFSIGRFYTGHYSGTGWCAGILNEYGYLD